MISILIPTHNRGEILSQTLESLSKLHVPEGERAELVVVANACTDNTEGVVAAWSPRMPLPTRCVVEPQPGLSVARNRAVAEACGEMLAFLDDDVRVNPGWLTAMLECFRTTGADIVGGRVHLWWQAVPRPAWFAEEFDSFLSICDHGDKMVPLTSGGQVVGANYAYTRRLADRVGAYRQGLGRTGNQLLGGEEQEYLNRAISMGFTIHYAPDAAVLHWVAPQRATESYLFNVAKGSGISQVLAKDYASWTRLLRSVVGHGYLVVWHGLLHVIARLTGRRTAAVRHGIRLQIGRGGLKGLAVRYLGVKLHAPTA